MSEPNPSLRQIKAQMRAAWMAGDFGVVAKTNAREGAAFAGRIGFAAGDRVLDIACGTGNVALALARAGAIVTGVDIATNLLEQGRARAAEAGLRVSFDEGDAEALPYPDAAFDGAASMFGAMFAPRPEVVAAECARVIRPRGRLAMANWTPPGFSGRMFAVGARHVAPPAGLAAPVLWGDETTVRARLEPYFEAIETTPIAMTFDLPVSPAGAVAFFRKFFGPTKMAFERLDVAGQARFGADLEDLWASNNEANDPESHTVVRNEYLQVMAVRR